MPYADVNQLRTPREVAERLNVSKMTVYRLIQSGDLPATRVGKSYRIARRDVDAMLVRNRGEVPTNLANVED